jgi:periplasmic divalent cation tolerance protein
MGCGVKDAVTILMTTGSKMEAKKIATVLVKKKLAACVQVLPAIESVYRWKGKTCRDKEVLVIMKSRKKLFLRLQKEVVRLHSYDVPQLVALPIIKGLPSYLSWMKKNLTSA